MDDDSAMVLYDKNLQAQATDKLGSGAPSTDSNEEE